MKYIWKSYISVLLIISLTITALSNVAGAASNSTREVKASDESSVEKSVYSINASISPDITAKVKELKKTVKREAKELQSENSKHYELNDGSFIAEISPGSPYYQDNEGEWHNAVTKLTDEANIYKTNVKISKAFKNSINFEKSDFITKKSSNYRPLQVSYDAVIPKVYSDGYIVRKNNSTVKLIPLNTTSVTGSIYNDSSIQYTDVWKNTNVTLTVLNNAIKEDIILKNADSPTVFSFEIQGLDETLKTEDLEIQSPWLIDQNGVIKNVEQKFRKEGNKKILDIFFDPTDLKFPVTIDPTVLTYTNNGIDNNIFFSGGEFTPSGNTGYSGTGYFQLYRYYDGLNRLNYGTGSIDFYAYPFPTNGTKVQFATLIMKYYGNGIAQTIDMNYGFNPYPYDAVFGSMPSTTVQGTEGFLSIDITNPIKAWFSSYQAYNMNSNIRFNFSTNSLNSSYSYYNWTPDYAKIIIGYNVYAPGTAAITSPQNGTIVDSNYNITWNAAIDQDDPQSSLKYNIQLSTNGGSTWSDIVPLTAAGASSYTYNFSSIANTTNAIIRIRPFDGIDYGSWVQSPTFTIKHNTVPNAPTALNPGSTNSATPTLVGTTTPALNWTFSDPDVGDTQGQYEVLIYNGTTLIRDSGWVSSSVASYTVPTSTLSRNGTYNWQVRTKDNKGAISALSAKYYIKVNNVPTVNVTSYTNGQQVTDNVLTFTWTYSDADGQAQSNYQIQGSQDNWTTVAYNSGALSGNATSFTTPPLASGNWSFRITAKDGLEWSAAATRSLVLPNAYEPNETTAQAYPINYAQNYTSLISTATDVDFYKYTATAAGIEKFKLTVPTGLNYDVYVYDASMNLIAAGIRGTGLAEEIIYNVNAGATYYIKIIGVGGSYNASANYGFSLNRQAAQYTTTYQYDANGNITGKTVTITN
ncbi:hypothetical protein [Cohnella hashimotonis]|uniref:Fibronectin type-III domain-containing protein n=1 Tax=Cohnella hashimotonis TaxID=2826895 RepID=A0ABT6TRW0_9BACL|nr:hypothetical protein [Cohnella hashimotonis]MDI4649592.1 hypothetical protein [Cohnella hashimotonis]